MTTDTAVAASPTTPYEVFRSDDPAGHGAKLADALGAALLDGIDGLDDWLPLARDRAVRRRSAERALELQSRTGRLGADEHRVTTVDGLIGLVERIRASDRMLSSTTEALRDRVTASVGLTVHPDTIRRAAAEVVELRSTRDNVAAELEEAEAAHAAELEASAEDANGVEQFAADETDEPSGWAAWNSHERRRLVRGLAAAGASIALCVAAIVLSGGGLTILLLPAVVAVWLVVLFRQQSESASGRGAASDNLAAVGVMTDHAYGGAGAAEPEQYIEVPPELRALRNRAKTVERRLAYAESAWTGLVGPKANVEDLENVIRVRDAQFSPISEEELGRTPTVRAANAHTRRLLAQWKLAWYVLDRPVPPIDAADAAIKTLIDEGYTMVTAVGFGAPGETIDLRNERPALHVEAVEATYGRTLDQLRADASRTTVAVVVDADGSIDDDALTARHDDESIRVVVVAPEAQDGATTAQADVMALSEDGLLEPPAEFD